MICYDIMPPKCIVPQQQRSAADAASTGAMKMEEEGTAASVDSSTSMNSQDVPQPQHHHSLFPSVNKPLASSCSKTGEGNIDPDADTTDETDSVTSSEASIIFDGCTSRSSGSSWWEEVEEDEYGFEADEGSNKKTVRFDLTATAVVEPEDVGDDVDGDGDGDDEAEVLQKNVRWYSLQDYVRFRSETRSLGRVVRNADNMRAASDSESSTYASLLVRLYENCRTTTTELALSTGIVVGNVIQPQDFKKLRAWARKTPGRIGIEKFSVAELCHQNNANQSSLTDTVLQLQDSWRENQQQHTDSGYDDLSELLRQNAEQISRPNRLFARVMAEAQAQADCDQSSSSSSSSKLAVNSKQQPMSTKNHKFLALAA